MLNFAAWIVLGGLLGLLTSRWLPGNTVPGTMLNSLAGAVGGFGGGVLVRTALAVLHLETARLSPWALAAALTGAVLLLVVVNLPARSRRVAVKPAENLPPRT